MGLMILKQNMMKTVLEKDLSFNKYISLKKREYYIGRVMRMITNLNADKLDHYIKKIKEKFKTEVCIIYGYIINKNRDRVNTIFYCDKLKFISGDEGFKSNDFEDSVMEYFYSNIDNSDLAISKKFKIPISKASYIINKHLDEKFRLLNLKINSS